MPPLPSALREAAAARHGLFTTEELQAVGITEREVRTAVRTGTWTRLRPGVFVTATDLAAARTARRGVHVAAAAVLTSLARPGAVLGHATAARLWRLPVPAGTSPDVRLIDPGRWRRGPGYAMTRALLPPDEVTWLDGLPVTTPARTLVDVAREWSELAAVAAIDAGLLHGLTTEADLRAVIRVHECAPRTPRAVRAVDLADGRAESWLETRGRLRFAAAGLPAFVPQVELWLDGRLVKVADGWYDEAALAVEFDGRVKYVRPAYGGTPEQVLFDEKRREDALRAAGVRFARLVDDDLGAGWDLVHRRLVRELAVPGPTERVFTAVPRPRGRSRLSA